MDGEVQGRRRRTHSPEFKAHVLQACSERGVSIAAVALSNGLNANLVRRWMNERDVCGATAAIHKTQLCASSSPTGGDRFVPVQLADHPAQAPTIRVDSLCQGWQIDLRNAPDASIINSGIAMNQHIAKPNDLAPMRHRRSQLWRMSGQL